MSCPMPKTISITLSSSPLGAIISVTEDNFLLFFSRLPIILRIALLRLAFIEFRTDPLWYDTVVILIVVSSFLPLLLKACLNEGPSKFKTGCALATDAKANMPIGIISRRNNRKNFLQHFNVHSSQRLAYVSLYPVFGRGYYQHYLAADSYIVALAQLII